MSSSPSPTTPHPKHWDTPAIRWVFELLLNLTSNTPRRCGSSGHPTRVFATPLQIAPSPHLTLRDFSRNHLLLHTKRANCALPPPARCPHALAPARSRTATRAYTSPPRCTSHLHPHAHVSSTALLRTMEIQRLLAPCALHAQPLLPRFFTSTFLPRGRACEAESVPRVRRTK
jgi:hypothetical protein